MRHVIDGFHLSRDHVCEYELYDVSCFIMYECEAGFISFIHCVRRWWERRIVKACDRAIHWNICESPLQIHDITHREFNVHQHQRVGIGHQVKHTGAIESYRSF